MVPGDRWRAADEHRPGLVGGGRWPPVWDTMARAAPGIAGEKHTPHPGRKEGDWRYDGRDAAAVRCFPPVLLSPRFDARRSANSEIRKRTSKNDSETFDKPATIRSAQGGPPPPPEKHPGNYAHRPFTPFKQHQRCRHGLRLCNYACARPTTDVAEICIAGELHGLMATARPAHRLRLDCLIGSDPRIMVTDQANRRAAGH